MKVLVFGATGTAGSGVLAACLQAREVSDVRVVARRAVAPSDQHAVAGSDTRVRLFVHQDYGDFAAVRNAFAGVDACLWALGISVRQTSGEAEYRQITHGYAMAAAAELAAGSPNGVLHFVSGQGTALDSRFMWARVKAETERDLAARYPTVSWRPAFIDGGGAATGPRLYRAMRRPMRLLRSLRSLYVTSEDIGRAMLQATRDGRRGGVVENAEIRALADRWARR